jgi:RNA polymerase sigma factor (sigma-70 family)
LADRQDLTALIEAVARRDRPAFKLMYEQTSARLYGIVLRIVRNRAVAEEVLQEVYLRVWEKASSYRPESGSPMSWMIAIARNRSIDVLRQRGDVEERTGDDNLIEQIADTSGVPDLAARDSLQFCLKRLDELHRHCIILAYCGGYSRDELATRFERPVNTIKTWLHRGLASLRECLEAQ